jgi:hypothetical protein
MVAQKRPQWAIQAQGERIARRRSESIIKKLAAIESMVDLGETTREAAAVEYRTRRGTSALEYGISRTKTRATFRHFRSSTGGNYYVRVYPTTYDGTEG